MKHGNFLPTTFMILGKSVSIRFRIPCELWQSVQQQKFSVISTWWMIATVKNAKDDYKAFLLSSNHFTPCSSVMVKTFKCVKFIFSSRLKFLKVQSSNLCSVTCWHKCVFASKSFETTLNLHHHFNFKRMAYWENTSDSQGS